MAETVGLIALNAVGITEIAGFSITAGTASIVGNVVIATALIGVSLANQPDGPKPQDGQLVTRQSVPKRRRHYGLVKVAGPLLFSETREGARYQVIAINQGEIDSFVDHWMTDTHVILNGAGQVVNAYIIDDQHFVQIQPDRGTPDATAYSTLLSRFPDIWTSAHRGRSIAKVLTVTSQPSEAKQFTTVYNGAQPPAYRALIRSSKVWDPRDSTQARNDPSSWKFSSNPVLHILDFHRVQDGMGLAAKYDPYLFTEAAIAEDWIPAANICDNGVPLANGGSEPRYSCAGGYELATPPKQVLAAMLATCDGQTYQRADGGIGIRVGYEINPVVEIPDEHITDFDGMQRGPTDSLTPVNQITAKYTARNLDYQLTDADAWRDEDAISETGREETRDLDLSWVPSHSQARRLMKIEFARKTPEWSGQIITNLHGIRAYSERYIRLRISELELDGTFEIVPGSFEFHFDTMTCSMSVFSMEQSAYDWDPSEEGEEPQTPPETDF